VAEITLRLKERNAHAVKERSSTKSRAPVNSVSEEALDHLVRFIRRHERLFVLTGAGVSTGSGIPDYRDAEGEWKRKQPASYGDFVRSDSVRRRYWARSLVGWRQFVAARPGRSHEALARLEAGGWIRDVVTQNVDRLHQEAGSGGANPHPRQLHGDWDQTVMPPSTMNSCPWT
jgi:NAD-dependent SIR2 family protein deacetylase